MFFEASRFGCLKTIFDATKITYNMYSCAISGMSKEMIEIDDRDRVEYQNYSWEYGSSPMGWPELALYFRGPDHEINSPNKIRAYWPCPNWLPIRVRTGPARLA